MMSGQQESKSEQSVKSGIQSQNQQPDRDTTQTQTQTQNIQSDQWDQQECQKLIERVASLEIQYTEMKEQVDDIEQKQWGMEEKCKEQLLYQMEDFYKYKLQSHIKPLITQLLSQMENPILAKVSNQECQVEQNNTSPNTNPKQNKQSLQQVQGISQQRKGNNELDQYDQFEIIDQNQNSESMKIQDHLQCLKEVQGNVEVVNKEYINEQIKEITKSLQENIDNLKSQSLDITQKQCNEKDDRYNSVLIQLEEQKSLIVNIQGEIQEKYRLQQQNLQSQQLQVDDYYNRIQQQLDNQQEGLKQIKEIQYQLQATLKNNDDKLNKVEAVYSEFNKLNQEALSQKEKAVTKIELSNGLQEIKKNIVQQHQEQYDQLQKEIVNLQDTTNKQIQAGSKLHQSAFDNLKKEIQHIEDEMSKKKQNLHNEQMQQQINKCRNSQQVQTEQLSEDNINKLQQQFSIQLTDQKQITDQMQLKIENHSIELQQITPQLQNIIKMQQTLVELQAVMNNKEDKLTNIQNQVGELKSEFTTLKSGIQTQIEQNVKTNENTLLRVSKQIEEQAETVNKLETKVGNIRQEISQSVNNSQLSQKSNVEQIFQQLRKEMVTSGESNIKDLELIISQQSGQLNADLNKLKLQIESLENYNNKGVEEWVKGYKTQIEETLKNHENKLTNCQNVYSKFKKYINKLEKDYQNSFDSKNTQVFEQRIIALEQKYIDFEQIQKSYKAELDKTAQQTQGELLKLQDQLDKMSKEVQISNETLSQVQLELKRKSEDVSVQLESCNNQLLKNKAQLSRQVVQLNEIVHQLEDIEKSFNIDKSARMIAGENSNMIFIADNKSNLPNEPRNQQNTSNYEPPSFVEVDSNDQRVFQTMNLANVTEISQQILDSEEIEMHNKYLHLQAQKLKALKLIDQLYDLSCRKRVIPEEFKAFVGSKQDYQGLLIEYDATEQLQQQLGTTILDGFRRIRGDGNCFYTSFVFQYLLLILNNKENQMFDKFMNDVKIMRFELIFEEGFSIPQADENYLKEEFMHRLQILRNSDNKERDLEKAFSTDQDIFYGLAIIYLRNLVYQLYQQDQHAQALYDSVCDRVYQEIITWEEMCNQNEIIIELLARKLNLNILVYFIENQNVQKKSYGEEGNTKILLILQPGHYQIGLEYIKGRQ